MTAVYSGSFNPLHEGHLAIISYLEEHFDRVLVVVSPESPFKAGNYATGQQRLEAARQCLKGRRAVVDDIEYHLEKPLYTINTLRGIAQREGEAPVLAIGGDSLATIGHWHAHEAILLEFGVVVFPRQGYDGEALRNELLAENPNYRITLLDTPLHNISSTEIRARSGV